MDVEVFSDHLCPLPSSKEIVADHEVAIIDVNCDWDCTLIHDVPLNETLLINSISCISETLGSGMEPLGELTDATLPSLNRLLTSPPKIASLVTRKSRPNKGKPELTYPLQISTLLELLE